MCSTAVLQDGGVKVQIISIPCDSFRGPPMKAGMRADGGRIVGEGGAAAAEDFGEIVEGFEGCVGDGLVGERQQVKTAAQYSPIGEVMAVIDGVARGRSTTSRPASRETVLSGLGSPVCCGVQGVTKTPPRPGT